MIGRGIEGGIGSSNFRMRRSAASIVALFFLLLLLKPSGSYAQVNVDVRDLRHWSTAETVRIVIDLSGPVEFSKSSLSNPERLFFDLKNTRLTKGLKTHIPISGGFLKTVRVGQFNATTVRIVFDLDTTEYDFKVFHLEDPARLIIDIFPGKHQQEKPDAKTEAGLLRKRVIIDPGHGGHDPGAVGARGLYEKQVVLDIALKVRDIIRSEFLSYDVVLTRDRDVFIPLPKRTEIANRNEGDLFVSIHANASPRRQARGIETYLLNWTNDVESMKVAARENAISLKKMKQVQDEVGFILASLERESKRNESGKLARQIQNVLVSTIGGDHPEVPDLGVKQALFYVLVDARMPSALVEVSFISNPEEERLLSDRQYRHKIAESIVRGINDYFSVSSPPKVVSNVNDSTVPDPRLRPVKYTRK